MMPTRPTASSDEDDRIDQRGDRLAPDRIDHLLVDDIPPQNGVEVAAAFARQQRRRVDARKQIAVIAERVGQGHASAHLLVHVVEHTAENRCSRPDAAADL